MVQVDTNKKNLFVKISVDQRIFYFQATFASYAFTSSMAFFTLTKGRMIKPTIKKKISERMAGRRLPVSWLTRPNRSGPN